MQRTELPNKTQYELINDTRNIKIEPNVIFGYKLRQSKRERQNSLFRKEAKKEAKSIFKTMQKS